MLVATPGQTTSYSIVHSNNTSNGSGGNSTAASATAAKKSATSNSINAATATAVKTLNNNNHPTSTVTTKTSLNSNANTTHFNNHQNSKSDNIVSNRTSNQNRVTATSSREVITHSLKNDNSTNANNTKQSFIQTLKESVQKALISTTGYSNNNSIVNKYSAHNKLQKNGSNSTSTNNVISSSSSTSQSANKISTATTSNNTTAVSQSSSSVSAIRGKYFSCSFSKLHTVAPTVMHRYPEERQHASSTDSLQKEMCHFKPIRIVPKTPWKSGSKSRGNCLRFPKANLATKNIEFVLKTNCDVNNRKRKQQQNRTRNVLDDNEQENKEFHGFYKPKPSLNCLSTSVCTANHQSAFVCLVTEMKDLVNLQSKRQLTPIKSAGTVVDAAPGETLKELYVRKKQKTATIHKREDAEAGNLPKIRSTRLSLNAVKNRNVSNETATQSATKDRVTRTNAKTNSISKVSSAAITKAKSRRNLGRAKSKTINMIATTKEKLRHSFSMPTVANTESENTDGTTNKMTRKRQIPQDDTEDLLRHEKIHLKQAPTSAKFSSLTRSRKSSRLSTKNINANKLDKSSTNINSQETRQPRKKPTSVVCFSPPMTRSRLKHLTAQGKIVTTTTTTTVDIKKRKI